MGTGHSRKTFLQQHTIADVLVGMLDALSFSALVSSLDVSQEPQKLMMIDSGHTVGEALAMLDEHKPPVISAPLFSEQYKTDIGIFDVQDAVALLYQKGENLLEIGDIQGLRKVWFDSAAFDAVESAGQDNVLPVQLSDTLEHVINQMVSLDSHRCALMDAEGAIKSLIAQSVMVKYLARHRKELLLHEQGEKSLRELNLGFVQHMIHVRSSDPVYAAFALMGKHSISSVVVLDSRGRMINSVSASNIRRIKGDTLEDLMLPTAEFLEKYKIRQMNTVTPGTSFNTMVNLMASQHGLHRVFILGENAQCLGVIALTDVLHEFYNQVEHPSEATKRHTAESSPNMKDITEENDIHAGVSKPLY